MRKLILTASILMLGAVSASAADMAPRYTKAPPMVAAAYDWSGFYVGGQVGGAWGRWDGDFLIPPFADFGSRRSTGAGGGFVGAQYQFSNNIVFGVETDVIALFDRSLGGGSCVPPASCGPANLRSVSLDPIWSAGARLGYAAGMWMPYVAGGFAGTRTNFLGVDAVPTNESFSQNRYGWYVGAGVDWAINSSWIVGAEYRHYDFGRTVGVPFDNLIGAFAVFDAVHVRLQEDTAMLRLSYKFGSPMVASYAPATAPRYTKAPPMVTAAYDWSGFYIGGQVGGAWGRFDGDFLTPPLADFGSRRSTGAGGGFFGAQYQFSNKIVFGVESDVIALFDHSLGAGPCVPAASCGPGSLRSLSLNSIWSAGARLGYAAGMWMPYVAGGFAGTKTDFLNTSAVPTIESFSQNRYGWYVGAGVDWAINSNWIIGAEYRHYDFGREVGVPFDNLAGGFDATNEVNIRLREDTAMVRASYKFGGPIVARY